MMGLGDVKTVVAKTLIYVSFVQKLLWYFFVKGMEFAQTGILLFEGHQLISVSKFCKMNLSTAKPCGFLISTIVTLLTIQV